MVCCLCAGCGCACAVRVHVCVVSGGHHLCACVYDVLYQVGITCLHVCAPGTVHGHVVPDDIHIEFDGTKIVRVMLMGLSCVCMYAGCVAACECVNACRVCPCLHVCMVSLTWYCSLQCESPVAACVHNVCVVHVSV